MVTFHLHVITLREITIYLLAVNEIKQQLKKIIWGLLGAPLASLFASSFLRGTRRVG